MKKKFYDILINLVVTILIIIDLFLKKIFKNKYFLTLIHDKIENRQYYSKVILKKKLIFFAPQKEF